MRPHGCSAGSNTASYRLRKEMLLHVVMTRRGARRREMCKAISHRSSSARRSIERKWTKKQECEPLAFPQREHRVSLAGSTQSKCKAWRATQAAQMSDPLIFSARLSTLRTDSSFAYGARYPDWMPSSQIERMSLNLKLVVVPDLASTARDVSAWHVRCHDFHPANLCMCQRRRRPCQ